MASAQDVTRSLLRPFVLAVAVLLVGGAIFVGVRRIADSGDGSPSISPGARPAETGCGLPIERYDEETLHRAYEMTLRMSEPDASPMWDDEQLQLSLTDPRFIAELERHFCLMEQMIAE